MKKLIASILSILIFTLTYNGINMQYAYGSSESKYIYVYAHENSNFAIREDGTIWQWGQMNNGTIRVTPTLIATLPNAIKCTSTHVLTSDRFVWIIHILTSNGFVWNFDLENLSLTQIGVLSNVVDIQEEYYTTSDGAMGSFSTLKQLYDIGFDDKLIDASILKSPELDGIKFIQNNYFLKENGTIYRYSDNNISEFSEIQGLSDIIKFDSIDKAFPMPVDFLAGLKNDGTVLTSDYSNNISTINNLTDIIQIAVGGSTKYGERSSGMQTAELESFCFCLRKDGTVWSIGDNNSGQLGNGTFSDTESALQVKGLTDIKSIDAGKEHAIALTNSGEIFTWGNNSYGQLGIGCSAIRKSPEKIAVVPGAVSISSGYDYITLCKNNGTVWELSLDATSNINSILQPTQVSNIKNARYINGENAIDKNGYVWIWDKEKKARKISDLSGITTISENYALKNDGTVWLYYYSGPSHKANKLKNVIDFNLDPVRSSGSAFGEYSNLIVLKKDGTAWEIPSFLTNELADGTGLNFDNPNGKINVASGAKKIVAPNYVLKNDGTVSRGEKTIKGLKDIRSISTYDGSKLFALKNDGTIWLSDNNSYKVEGITNAIGITVGGKTLWDTDFMNGEILHQFFAVLEKDGSVFVWGNNEDGLITLHHPFKGWFEILKPYKGFLPKTITGLGV